LEINLEGNSCLLSSGAPDSLMRDPLPYLSHPTVGQRSYWRTGHCPVHTGLCPVHTGQSGVPNRPLARATRRPLIALVTVGSGGSDSPDSLVHHRTVR
jgi:hypothetical protein